MSLTTTALLRAISVAVAPVGLLAAAVWHPHIPGRLPNDAAIAAAVTADPTGWGLSHLAAAVASALVLIAFVAIRDHLRARGEEPWSALALPFVVIGSTLYAVLPGMEFAPLAAAEAGGDVEAAQAALAPWFLPVLLAGAVSFAIGVLAFARGVTRSRVLSRRLTALVVGALVVMAAARFVPLAAVQFYVHSAAAFLGLWPLAHAMWRQTRQQAGRPQTVPAR